MKILWKNKNVGNREVNTDGLEYGNNHNSLEISSLVDMIIGRVVIFVHLPSLDTLMREGGRKKVIKENEKAKSRGRE